MNAATTWAVTGQTVAGPQPGRQLLELLPSLWVEMGFGCRD